MVDFNRLPSGAEMMRMRKQREQRDKLAASQLAKMLKELVALDEGLSGYEVDFVEDHSHRLESQGELSWYYGLSPKQMAFLQQTYERRT